MKFEIYTDYKRVVLVKHGNLTGVAILGKKDTFDLYKGVQIALVKLFLESKSTLELWLPLYKKVGWIEVEEEVLNNLISALTALAYSMGFGLPTLAITGVHMNMAEEREREAAILQLDIHITKE